MYVLFAAEKRYNQIINIRKDNPMKAQLPYIQTLLDDPTVEKILIDGWQHVYSEKKDGFEDIPNVFKNEAELLELVQALANILDLPVDRMNSLTSLRLPDGTRVDLIMPPISMIGPAITILKANPKKLHLDDLLNSGAISHAAAVFLNACVASSRINIVIAGMSNAGKTTLLNCMAEWIPIQERILYLHHRMSDAELPHQRLIPLETRPPNMEGKGAVTMTDLIQGATHMRPDRIIVEEVLGTEAAELILAMNHGYDGTLFTVNAYSPRDAFVHLERWIAMGNPELPLQAIREQITSAIELIVQIEQLRDGNRKVVAISEVVGMDNGIAELSDIFLFQQVGFEDGVVLGSLNPTGHIPNFLSILSIDGLQVPVTLFNPDHR